MRKTPQYVTCDDVTRSIPRVDSEMRERGRYSGVGAVIDDLSGGFDDPDDTDDAVIEDILGKAPRTAAGDFEPRAQAAGAPRSQDSLAVASEALSQAIENRRAVEEALRKAGEECDRAEEALRKLVETQRACDAARDAALRWSHAESKSVQSAPPEGRAEFSQFKAVYESRDGKLCLFEDASGHLVAVDTERLA